MQYDSSRRCIHRTADPAACAPGSARCQSETSACHEMHPCTLRSSSSTSGSLLADEIGHLANDPLYLGFVREMIEHVLPLLSSDTDRPLGIIDKARDTTLAVVSIGKADFVQQRQLMQRLCIGELTNVLNRIAQLV